MTVTRVFKTDINTIIIVNAETNGCGGRRYVSVTANEIEPLAYKKAEAQSREYLEDGEAWRMAVQAGQTDAGLDDWIDGILVENPICGIDNSAYSKQLKITGVNYIFESLSGGCLHEVIKKCTPLFDHLIALHLKDDPKSLQEAENIIMALQMESDEDYFVEKYTREIVEP